MREIQKFILLKGKVETLSFFSERLKEELEKRGYECFLFDFDKEVQSFMKATWFVDEKTALFTFNFIGMSGEPIFKMENGETFWKQRKVLCMNMLVDHPFYYHEQLSLLSQMSEYNKQSGKFKNYIQFCVDKDHVKYCKRFFPEVCNCYFLSLAGSAVKEYIPYENREIDVMFAGNFTPLETFLPYINRTGEENAAFYFEILEYLKENPDSEISSTIEKFLRRDFPDVTESEVKGCMGNSMFLDLYIRFFFRGEVIKCLVDNGIEVDVFGSGWDLFDCKCPENLRIHGPQKTAGCLKAMANAKISLNVMPWFKNGAHDRIYSSLASGCVCFTDKSEHLLERFTDGEQLVFYDLKNLDKLPELVKTYLEAEEQSEGIADAGKEHALKYESWEQRTEEILGKIKLIRSI